MAGWVKNFRSYFQGFGNILTGIVVGAGLTKIFYKTSDTENENDLVRKQIEEVISTNDNLKQGRHLRTITPGGSPLSQRSERKSLDKTCVVNESQDYKVFKYGLPQRSPDFIRYKNHVLCYDQAKRTPRWVMEHLTKDKMKGEADRALSTFKPDFNIPVVFQSSSDDYWDSGWSRGHMAPASNNKHDQEAMDETFYLSNIVPQDLDNNAGFWYRIEVYCRSLTKRYSDVYVISGPLYLPREEDGKQIVRYELIGANNVAVPTHLYKVILAEDSDKPIVLGAFVIPNEPIGFEYNLKDFQVQLNDLEKYSGLVFFPGFDVSKAYDVCEKDGCRLLSKERMDFIVFGRQLRNTSSLEDLENVWKELSKKNVNADNFTREIYEKKKEKLQKVEPFMDVNQNEKEKARTEKK